MYHVRIDYFDKKLKKSQTLFDFDYVEKDTIIQSVLLPYLNKKLFIFAGARLDGNDVSKVRVFSTEQNISQTTEYANSTLGRSIAFFYTNEEVLTDDSFVTEITRQILQQAEQFVNSNQKTDMSISKQINKTEHKIFISHSSDDKDFAKALIDLLEKCGFGEGEIFCSSVPGYWVKSKSFCEVIREQFESYNLYVIFIHSPRFYGSHVALNEMGAAWVLQNEHYSFLTKDMSFDGMDGLIDNKEIACKVDTNEANGRLLDFIQTLTKLFDKKFEMNKWERRRDTFLKEVNEIIYFPIEEKRIKLSDFDIERMKQWVSSNDNDLLQIWYEGGSATFGLGAINQYNVRSGKEMSEWIDFLNRMEKLGYIERVGESKKHPDYRLTHSAFERFEKH